MKPQNKKKKRTWTRPAWLNRIRLDKRTKLVCLFVVVIAGTLFFLHQYSMRYVRNLQYDGTTVTDREVFAQLKSGTAEIGSAVWLPHFAANEPLYRRGSHYYIGNDYVRVQDGAPILINDGTYVNLIGGEGTLIDAQWLQQPAMAGMYLSNGQSFNYDGTMVDEEPVLFFRMDNGLYMNIKSLALYGLLQDVEIPVNSFLHIDEDGIRYYARQSGELLLYSSFTQIYEASVEIDGQRMSYTDFLIKLGIYKETDIRQNPEEEPTETMTVPETESNEGGSEDSTSKPELSLEDLMEAEQGKAGDDSGNQQEGQAESENIPGNSNGDAAGDKELYGDKDNLGDGQADTKGGSPDRDEIPDRLPDNHKNSHKNKDKYDNWGNGDNNKGDNPGSNAGNGNETSGGNGDETSEGSGNETSGGSGDETSGGSGGETSGGSGDETSGGSGTETSGGSGNETSGGSGTETSGGGGNETSGGNGNETSGGNETKPNESKPIESLPVASDNNAERPTLPIATDSNAGRPGSGDEEGGNGGSGGSGGDWPPYEIEWQKPEIILSELETDVYSGTGSLEIEDPYGCFAKVVLSLAWNDKSISVFDPNLDTSVRYRKTLSGKGDFMIDNLPPDTKIFVAAYLQYYDRDGKRVRETEPFKTMLVKTRPFSEVDHICVSFTDDIAYSSQGRYYEKQAGVYDLQISAANGYLLNKVSRGEITMYPDPTKGDDTPVKFKLSSSALKRYMTAPQDYISSTAQGILKPATVYRYRVELWDSFNNSFTESNKVIWGNVSQKSEADYYKASGYDVVGKQYHPDTDDRWPKTDEDGRASGILGSQRFWGYTHTSKTKPRAILEQNILSAEESLEKAQITVKLEDLQEALIAASGAWGDISGTAPEDKNGNNYKIYMALYAQKSGFAEGKELLISQKEDGTITIGEAGGSRFCYVDSTALPGNSGKAYLIEGLTAGDSYMIRIFGSYNLDDNAGNMYDIELGSLRFETILLGNYGRIAYTFTSSHYKTKAMEGIFTYNHDLYESATAQKLSMVINPSRSNPLLAERYFDRFYIQLKNQSTNENLIRLSFSKEKRDSWLLNKTIKVPRDQLESDGTYVCTLSGVNAFSGGDGNWDYGYEFLSSKQHQAPEVQLKIPVDRMPSICVLNTSDEYEINLWDAFLGVGEDGKFLDARAELLLTFEENSLESNTNYVFSVESYASQGSEDSHIVTAQTSYSQRKFSTLKEMPYVIIGGTLQVGRYLYLVDIDFHDKDGAIYDKKVMLRNVNTSRNNATSTKTEILDFSDGSSGGRIKKASFESLQLDSKYKLEIVPLDIRRSKGTAAPRYQTEVLETYTYTAGKGVVGNLFMMGLTHPLEQLTEQKNGKTVYHTAAEYNRYEIGNFTYGTISGGKKGEKVEIQPGSQHTQVMDPILVEPGQIYYLKYVSNIAFLDRDQNLAGPIKSVPSNGAYIKIPAGVSYIQPSINGANRFYQAQVLLVYEKDSVLETKLQMVSGQKDPVGKTITFNEDDLRNWNGDTIALVSGEWVGGGAGNISITCKNQAGTIIGFNGSYQSGSSFKIPEGTTSVSVTVNSTLLDMNGGTVAPDLRIIRSDRVDLFSKYVYNELIADYQVTVTDNNGSLSDNASGDVRVVVKAFDKDGNEADIPEGAELEDHIGDNGIYGKAKSFQTQTEYKYQLFLEICWRGNWYPLDEQEFTATESEYSIATGNQLLKLRAWPFSKFRVIADLGEIHPYTLLNMGKLSFNGSLNAQGHSMTVRISDSSYSSFLNIGDNGILENLDLTSILGKEGDEEELWRYIYPIGSNYGQIRNIIVHIRQGIKNFRHDYGSGLCGTNVGTIENFAVYYESTTAGMGSYVGSWFGGLVEENAGTVRNGVVYGRQQIDVTTGVYKGDKNVALTNVGGVVGYNRSTGVVEQVLSILNMRVERNAYAPEFNSNLGSYGLIVGGNGGRVRNCFTSGEMYYRYWERTERFVRLATTNIAWPGCNSSSSPAVKNCYYFSMGAYKTDNSNVKYLSGRAALKSEEFYGNTINRDNGFVVESQLKGDYYPIVNMPECMDGKQLNISLNATAPGSVPVYISSDTMKDDSKEMRYLEKEYLSAETVKKIKEIVKDETLLKNFLTIGEDGTAVVDRQFALTNIVISNRNSYLIDNIRIEGLTVEKLDIATTSEFSTIEALVSPYVKNANGQWALSALADSFSASHTVQSFDYGSAANAMATASVTNESMNVDFYYPLSYETWNNQMPKKSNTNYRLIEDISMESGEGKFKSDGAVVDVLKSFNDITMQAIFDGGGHTLDFSKVSAGMYSKPYFFWKVGSGGEIKNLNVTDFHISRDYGGDGYYVGLIGTAETTSILSDIHIKNVELENARRYAGAVVANAQSNTIVNCTVAGVKIRSNEYASGLCVGGIAGYRTGQCVIKNSFVRDADLDTTKGDTVSGTGGLVGYDTVNVYTPMITSCYAHGMISSGFANAGGLVGRGNTRITNAWSAVDIIGTNRVGSVMGYAAESGSGQYNSFSRVVVSGELYASNESIERRMAGSWQRGNHVNYWSRAYAYEEQRLNSKVDKTNHVDVTALTGMDEMMQPQFWSETVALGRYFHLTGIDSADEKQAVPGVHEAAVYPLLYADDASTLLPDQKAIYYHIEKPEFNVISTSVVDKGIDPQNHPYGYYDIEFTMEIDDKDHVLPKEPEKLGTYLKERLTADGLDFQKASFEYVAGSPAEKPQIKIKNIDAVRRLDSYRLNYRYGDDINVVSAKLDFKDGDGKDIYLFWQIENIGRWREVTINNGRGKTYENFLICGDINLSTVAKSELGLKLNRLQGRPKDGWSEDSYDYKKKPASWNNASASSDFYKIYGLNLSQMEYPWITEITNYMGYLDIRDCTLYAGKPLSTFGIIGNVNSDVEYVDFYNNKIILTNVDSGTYANIGCLGVVRGRVYRSRIGDIKIEMSGGAGYQYSEVGGLAGWANALDQIYACGRRTADENSTYAITMGMSGITSNRSNFGGIAGYVNSTARNLYGEKLDVRGIYYVGALVGGYAVDGTSNLETRSCRVTGKSYIGGAMGRANGISNAKVMGAEVEAYDRRSDGNGFQEARAGGIVGSCSGISNGEVYQSKVISAGNYAGGIAATSNSATGCKAAYQCTITAEGNYAGGIVGSGYCTVNTCAVYDAEISGNAYVGGIIGYNANTVRIGARNLQKNVVSKAKITGKNNRIGGIAGYTAGADIYANAVMDTVEINGSFDCGGVAGYSSGGVLRYNIVGATVKGTENIGGLAGQLLGYGISPEAGVRMHYEAAKAYGNLIVCKEIEATKDYVGGLIGAYVRGEEPKDGEGEALPNTGYHSYMSSVDFYGNGILAESIKLTNEGATQNYYANYAGERTIKYRNGLETYSVDPEKGDDGLPKYPRYDLMVSLFWKDKISLLGVPTLATEVGYGGSVQETLTLDIQSDSYLKEQNFYVLGNADGGLGFNVTDFNYGGLSSTGTSYYPYVLKSEGNLMPYQKDGTYFKMDGDTWKEETYSGEGIKIPTIETTRNLRSVARGMVYPSGPDTINIDFSRIDNSLVNFDIEGEEEYLEKTSIDAVKDKAGVCSMTYDYQTDFVLNLYSLDGSVKETYVYYADNLRRTVMSWNGKNYYILSDGIYQGMEDGTSKKVLDGEFVNLYQGAALDSEGKVHELAPSPAPAKVKKKAAEEELEELLSSAEAEEESEELLSSADAEEISEEFLSSADAEEVSNEHLSSDKPEEEPDQLLPFHESERDDEQKEENDAWSGPDSQSE